jgi:hypothetical protein
MNIEQGCKSLSRFAKCDGWKSAGRVLSVHILLNEPGSYSVGPSEEKLARGRKKIGI